MSSKSRDGRDTQRLDLARLAADDASIRGQWPLAEMSRLVDLQQGDVSLAAPVDYTLTAELRPVKGGEPQVWLHVQAQATLSLCCQRCLGPVAAEVAVDRWLQFVSDEALAAELDADSEDDVLVLERWLDARELAEDELLLELPLVPRHEVCPEPLPQPVDDLEPAPAEENPFAMLAKLKKGDAGP